MTYNITHNTPATETQQINKEIDNVFRLGYETGKASAHNNGTPNDQLRMW